MQDMPDAKTDGMNAEKMQGCFETYLRAAASCLSFCNSVEASKVVLADATFLAFSKITVDPQYGQVLVFCSTFASRRPPHLAQTTTNVRPTFFT
jgi:hypothetical protein